MDFIQTSTRPTTPSATTIMSHELSSCQNLAPKMPVRVIEMPAAARSSANPVLFIRSWYRIPSRVVAELAPFAASYPPGASVGARVRLWSLLTLPSELACNQDHPSLELIKFVNKRMILSP